MRTIRPTTGPTSLAIAGPAGSGKSVAATAMVEATLRAGGKVLLIDPIAPGDYLDDELRTSPQLSVIGSLEATDFEEIVDAADGCSLIVIDHVRDAAELDAGLRQVGMREAARRLADATATRVVVTVDRPVAA